MKKKDLALAAAAFALVLAAGWWWKQRQAATAATPDPTANSPYGQWPSVNGSYT